MSLAHSWQFIGGVESLPYRLFDALRRGLNRRLVARLLAGCAPPAAETAHSNPTHDRAGRRVLEAGSGTAFATSLLADDPHTRAAVCLDMDVDALRIARRRDPRILAVVGDLRRLPFADGVFDLTFSSSTLEHLEEPLDALREMTRVCHLRGRVFAGVPYAFGPLAFQPLIRRTRWGVWIGPVFSRLGLDALLRKAGLRPFGHCRYFGRFFIGAMGSKEVCEHIEASAQSLREHVNGPGGRGVGRHEPRKAAVSERMEAPVPARETEAAPTHEPQRRLAAAGAEGRA